MDKVSRVVIFNFFWCQAQSDNFFLEVQYQEVEILESIFASDISDTLYGKGTKVQWLEIFPEK